MIDLIKYPDHFKAKDIWDNWEKIKDEVTNNHPYALSSKEFNEHEDYINKLTDARFKTKYGKTLNQLLQPLNYNKG